jgi:UV DNA damage endonuclease
VARLAVDELEVQAELMDGMGLGPEAVVVLHVGGAAGGVHAGLDRFERGFALLSDAAKARVGVENDDRRFGLGDVLRLSERIGRPVVWDVLHHHCHDPAGIPDREALSLALATWPKGVTPKIHFASSKTAVEERSKRVGRRVERSVVLPPMRAHADLVDAIALEHFLRETGRGLEFDVMLEAKAKDLALMRVRDQLAARRSHDRPHRPASFLGQPRHPLSSEGQEPELLSSPEQPEADSQKEVPPPGGP